MLSMVAVNPFFIWPNTAPRAADQILFANEAARVAHRAHVRPFDVTGKEREPARHVAAIRRVVERKHEALFSAMPLRPSVVAKGATVSGSGPDRMLSVWGCDRAEPAVLAGELCEESNDHR